MKQVVPNFSGLTAHHIFKNIILYRQSTGYLELSVIYRILPTIKKTVFWDYLKKIKNLFITLNNSQ